jgi:hypothetical protein
MSEQHLIDDFTNTVMEIIRAEFDLYEAPEYDEPYSQDDHLYAIIHQALKETYMEVLK